MAVSSILAESQRVLHHTVKPLELADGAMVMVVPAHGQLVMGPMVQQLPPSRRLHVLPGSLMAMVG